MVVSGCTLQQLELNFFFLGGGGEGRRESCPPPTHCCRHYLFHDVCHIADVGSNDEW